jgi:hypothetical protein
MEHIILNLNNQILDGLDMKMSKHINNDEYKGYFNERSSKEHYRLLTHISSLYNNINILDIGTLKGCSALALSTNNTNKVFSFNLDNQLELIDTPKNIEFIIDNVINGKYDDLILSSPIILLDTFHDGVFEQEFLDYLLRINYKGNLLLDDIHLNKEMQIFWENINLLKNDITCIGHSTGTGIVYFK